MHCNTLQRTKTYLTLQHTSTHYVWECDWVMRWHSRIFGLAPKKKAVCWSGVWTLCPSFWLVGVCTIDSELKNVLDLYHYEWAGMDIIWVQLDIIWVQLDIIWVQLDGFHTHWIPRNISCVVLIFDNDTYFPKPAHSQHISECHILLNQRMMTGSTFSLQHTATHSPKSVHFQCTNFWEHVAVCCSVLQCVAVRCSKKVFPVIKPWLQLFSSYLWHRSICGIGLFVA